jgi:hypothetical protein
MVPTMIVMIPTAPMIVVVMLALALLSVIAAKRKIESTATIVIIVE